MRIQCKPAIVLLCLWISAAHSQYSAVAPEDQDTSGDDQDFSGSGDEGSASQGTSQVKEIMWTQNVTLAVSNATETAWVTDAPVRIPELTTSQHSTVSDNMAQEPVATTPPLSTTIVLDNVEPPTTTAPPDTFQGGVLDDDTTTLSPSIEEETTALPVEETPAVPSIEEETTITSVVDKEPVEEESTTSSPIEEETDDGTTPAIILDEEDGTTVSVEVVDFATDEPDAKTTPLPQTTSTAADPALEDEVSGDGSEETPMTEFTTQGMGLGTEEKDLEEKNIIPQEKPKVEVPKPADGDFDFDNEIRPKMQKPLTEEISGSSDNENLLERTEVLAGVIAGGVVGLAFAIMLVSLMVYRMKKKDEGSYALDEHKHPNGGYQKAQRQEEFLA